MRSVLIGASLWMASSFGFADTIGNAGDPLRTIFLKGRDFAASITNLVDAKNIPSSIPTEVARWIADNNRALANDISASSHAWTTDQRPTCAFTNQELAAPVVLSFPTCRVSVVTAVDAAQLLIHESVHHLGINDETFADQVALAVYRSWLRKQKGDLGFRFNPQYMRCENSDGEIGRNLEFLGECGDFMLKDLSNRDLSRQTLRGVNLSFADLLGTNFNRANLRGADLSFAKIRRAILHEAVFEQADLRYAQIEWGGDPNVRYQDRIFFQQANLAYATLRAEQVIAVANFEGANLQNARLEFHQSVYAINFRDADLTRLQLVKVSYPFIADLSGANLTEVDLRGKYFGKNFHDAILRGANLTNYDLTAGDFSFRVEPPPAAQPILTGAKFDSQTILPFSEEEAIRRGMVKVR